MIKQDKVAVVTGTSGQLGPVWCETLDELGYDVYEIDLPRLDVSDRKTMQWAARECFEYYGVPTVLVLNAAIDNPPGSVASFHGNLARILEVNLIGACNVVEAFLAEMIINGGGTIIPITSIQGYIGADWRNYEGNFEKPVAYNLSKSALMQYARSLTVQFGRYGIRAGCIGFGPYDGGKIPKAFLGKF